MPFFEIEPEVKQKLYEAEIIAFLNQHPDFLIEHAARIHLFNDFKYNIFQLARKYREENIYYEKMLENLMLVAQENFEILNQLHAIHNRIVQAPNLKQALSELLNEFIKRFSLAAVSMIWRSEVMPDSQRNSFNRTLSLPENTLFRFMPEQELRKSVKTKRIPLVKKRKCRLLKDFFPGANLDHVQAGVIIPLFFEQQLQGAIALGDQTNHRFHADMSYDFIMETADQIAKTFYALFIWELLYYNPSWLTPTHFFDYYRVSLENYHQYHSCCLIEIIFAQDSKKPQYSDIKPHFHHQDIFFYYTPEKLIFLSDYGGENCCALIEKINRVLSAYQPQCQRIERLNQPTNL